MKHSHNLSYSEGGDRRIESLRPAQEKLMRAFLKNKINTKVLGV
jgi:hypothetical protein